MGQRGIDLLQEPQALCLLAKMIWHKGVKHPQAFLNSLLGEPNAMELS
jgi:hypothetical protein